MGREESIIPFGLLFAENAPNSQVSRTPIYDEKKGYSFVEEKGTRIPFVEFGGHLGTLTSTKAEGEKTDEDPDDEKPTSVASTQTITAIRAESTDQDR